MKTVEIKVRKNKTNLKNTAKSRVEIQLICLYLWSSWIDNI